MWSPEREGIVVFEPALPRGMQPEASKAATRARCRSTSANERREFQVEEVNEHTKRQLCAAGSSLSDLQSPQAQTKLMLLRPRDSDEGSMHRSSSCISLSTNGSEFKLRLQQELDIQPGQAGPAPGLLPNLLAGWPPTSGMPQCTPPRQVQPISSVGSNKAPRSTALAPGALFQLAPQPHFQVKSGNPVNHSPARSPRAIYTPLQTWPASNPQLYCPPVSTPRGLSTPRSPNQATAPIHSGSWGPPRTPRRQFNSPTVASTGRALSTNSRVGGYRLR